MTAYTVDRLTKGAGRRAPRLRRPSHPLFYAACIWAATHASGTTTVYVDGGADAGGTGAADRPLASISAAVGRATSGDRILVAPGRYLENVVLQTEGLILAARDARRPELRSPTAGRPALTIEADRCTAKHLRFSGGQGVVIRASYTTVRNCTFERSSEPLQAWGRCHTITFCDVRNCAGPPQGGLFRVAGPNSYVGGNRFVNNTGAGAAVSLSGRGSAVCNNIISGEAVPAVRFAIEAVASAVDSEFKGCARQLISHNRLYGRTGSAFVRLSGPAGSHREGRVVSNTVCGLGGTEATGFLIEDGGSEATIEKNLIGDVPHPLILAGFDAGDLDSELGARVKSNTFFGHVGEAEARAGGASAAEKPTASAVAFAATRPDDAAFLWPEARSAVSRTARASPHAGARPPWPSPDPRNLAFGRDYLVSWIERVQADDSLPLCLTDGYRFHSPTGGLGGGKGHALWHVNSQRSILYFWVDLGTAQAIDAVRLSMAHNHVGRLIFPVSVDVSVSENDVGFRKVGTIVPDRNASARFDRVEVNGLGASGRYVLLTMHTDFAYTVVDEIEVLAPPDGAVAVRPPTTAVHGPPGEPLAISALAATYPAFYRENKADLQSVRDRAESLGVLREAAFALDAAARAVREQAKIADQPRVERALHAACQAVSQAAFHGEGFVLSASSPYGKVSSFHVPGRAEAGLESVSIVTCQDEREPCAFVVTNVSDRDLQLALTLSACRRPDEQTFPPGQIVWRSPVDAVFTKDRNGKPCYVRYRADPLVLIGRGSAATLALPRGTSRQVWVTVDTSDVSAGVYTGGIELTAADVPPKQLTLAMQVHPVRIPEHVALYSYVWAYWGAKRARACREEVEKEAIGHRVNSMLDHGVPRPAQDAYDKEGHLVKPLNYGSLDAQLDRWHRRMSSGKVKFYVFRPLFEYKKNRILGPGFQPGTPEWATALREWMNDLGRHLDERHGLTTDDFAFYLFDELEGAQLISVVKVFADALLGADPQRYPYARRVKTFINPMQGFMLGSAYRYIEENYDRLGVICPALTEYPDHVIRRLQDAKEAGCRVWSYLVQRRSHDPYAKGKLVGWLCMRDGFDGLGFWIYADSRDFGGYDVVYTQGEGIPGAGDEKVIPSRRWEGWRDGQEDYHLLWLLKQLGEEGASRGLDDRQIGEAREAFRDAIRQVFAQRDDPQAAVIQRERIIRTLLKLGHDRGGRPRP